MRLRRELLVTQYKAILAACEYVGVIQLTRSTSWGKSGTRLRILAEAEVAPSDAAATTAATVACTDTPPPPPPPPLPSLSPSLRHRHDEEQPLHADVRYAIPKALRIATDRVGTDATRRMAPLFRGSAVLLIYGDDPAAWQRVLRSTERVVEGAVLLGAKVGDRVVSRARIGALEPMADMHARIVRTLDAHACGLASVLERAAGARDLVAIVRRAAARGGDIGDDAVAIVAAGDGDDGGGGGVGGGEGGRAAAQGEGAVAR